LRKTANDGGLQHSVGRRRSISHAITRCHFIGQYLFRLIGRVGGQNAKGRNGGISPRPRVGGDEFPSEDIRLPDRFWSLVKIPNARPNFSGLQRQSGSHSLFNIICTHNGCRVRVASAPHLKRRRAPDRTPGRSSGCLGRGKGSTTCEPAPQKSFAPLSTSCCHRERTGRFRVMCCHHLQH
jgi:hypothetical protein